MAISKTLPNAASFSYDHRHVDNIPSRCIIAKITILVGSLEIISKYFSSLEIHISRESKSHFPSQTGILKLYLKSLNVRFPPIGLDECSGGEGGGQPGDHGLHGGELG